MNRYQVSHFAVLCGIFVFFTSSAYSQEAELIRFQEQLSSTLLGSSSPIQDGGSKSFLGVAIVPPGEAWSLTAGEDVLDRSPWGTSRLALQFNYPIEVNGGLANVRRQQRLERCWQRILSASVPKAEISPEATQSAIFRPLDRVDVARGLDASRMPSEKYLRYQEYSAAWRVIRSADANDGAWRFHPRFSRFSSLDEARTQLDDEWTRFGHRIEVETAIEQFDVELTKGGWKSWLIAKSLFIANTLDAVPEVPTGRTTLFPPEIDWHDMRAWNKVVFSTQSGSKISCQIARVKVIRPWFDWPLILDGSFRIGKESDLDELSDGAVPTNATYAKGQMANFAEDIILVRRIQGASTDTSHPLGRFESADTDVPQLIGFIVRSLPKIGPSE
jgi:hypothetical protein